MKRENHMNNKKKPSRKHDWTPRTTTKMDKALIATNIQADATMDVVCANGQRIQQAWEDNIEDSED